jgi:hypothetical protein
VESPIEARGGLRMGDAAGNGTITVGADTAATANRLVQRDSGGDIYGRYFFGVHFNQSSSNTENPSIAAFWTNSGSDNYNRKSSPAHVISQLGLITTGNYSSYALPLTGGSVTGRLFVSINGRTNYYTGSNIEVLTSDNTPPSISFHRGGYSATSLYENDGELYTNAWTSRAQNGKLLSSGNYSSYALPLSGGTITGTVTFNGANELRFADQNNAVRGFIASQTNAGSGAAGLTIATSGGEDIVFKDGNAQSGDVNLTITGTRGALLSPGVFGSTGWASSAGNGTTRWVSPKGGAASWDGSQTGAIKIRLPFRANDSMWRMKVYIYNYSGNTMWEYHIGNYAYSAGGYNSAASCICTGSASPLTVRWGNDGSYDCVWIGETNSGWSYLQVAVTEFSVGFRSATSTANQDAWDISYVTSFGTVATSYTPSVNLASGSGVAGNAILHAGNYSSYALPLSGGTLTGGLTLTNSTSAITLASGYYIGMGDWGLRNSTPYGWIQLGPANSSWCHIYGSQAFYFNQELYVNNQQVLHSGNYSNYPIMRYAGYFGSGNWQNLTDSVGELRVDQVNDINNGGYSNQPPSVYTYGGVLSWRTDNHSFQLYASHTGDLTFKTQWNNDNYSGWRRILHESNYNSFAPSLTGSGASGTWSINITGNAASISGQANSATITASTGVNGSHIVQRDGNGYIYANHVNFNTGVENPTIANFITDNGDGWSRKSSLAHVKNQIRGVADGTWGINITGSASSASTASSASSANAIGSTGFGNNNFTWRQDSGTFAGYSGWASYMINSHGDGDTYYSQTLIMPFWSAPQYSRKQGNSSVVGPYTFLTTENYTNYSPSLTGSGASGTWGINISGSAGSASSASSATTAGSVSGLTLTSSSNGINPDSVTQNQIGYNTSVSLFGQSDGGLYSSAYSSAWIHQIYGDFRTGQIAIRGKNSGSWQSWRTVLDSGNYSSYALPLSGGTVSGTANFSASQYPIFVYGNANTGSASTVGLQVYSSGGNGAIMAFHRGGYYAVNMGLDSDNVIRIGGWSASANRWQLDMSGNGTYAGNVTAYSDERLKKDWSPIYDGFVDRLAIIRAGTYTRIDSGERQAGVSAQAMRELLPEVVSEDNEGTLALAYGNAAMVSAVELAKELVQLKRELAELKSKLH